MKEEGGEVEQWKKWESVEYRESRREQKQRAEEEAERRRKHDDGTVDGQCCLCNAAQEDSRTYTEALG